MRPEELKMAMAIRGRQGKSVFPKLLNEIIRNKSVERKNKDTIKITFNEENKSFDLELAKVCAKERQDFRVVWFDFNGLQWRDDK